ncbi:MAG: response regulator [Desulfovibrio sp.]
MEWLVPSILCNTFGTAILCAVYAFLFHHDRHLYLRTMAFGWGIYATRFVSMLFYANDPQPIFFMFNQLFSLWSGICLLAGTYQFLKRKFSPRWYLFGLCSSLWIIYSISAQTDFFWISAPTFFLLGGVFFQIGYVLLKKNPNKFIEQKITGILFILWGLHKADYPFLRPIENLAPWGYLLGALFEFSVALTFLLLFFHSNKRQLSADKERYRILFTESRDAIIGTDIKRGVVIDCNPAAEKLFNIKRTRLFGQLITALFFPPQKKTSPPRLAQFQNLLLTKLYDQRTMEARIQSLRGSRHVSIHPSIISFAEEKILVTVIRDITDLVETRSALETSERLHRELFENSPLGMLYIGNDGCIKQCNDRFIEFMGSSRSLLIGFNVAESSGTASMQRAIQQAIKGHKSYYEDYYTSVTGQKTTYLRVYFNPLHPEAPPCEVIATLEEITQQKEAEEAIVLAKEEAESANKAKSDFLANMSHEIRTPINGVMGMLQLMATTPLNKEQTIFVNTALKSTSILTQLLGDVLDLSKVEAGTFTLRESRLRPSSLLDMVTDTFGVNADEKSVQLLISQDDNVPEFIMSDPVRMRQILLNLVGNALKFTDHGTIAVNLSYMDTHNSSRLLFSVADTGIGMPEDKLNDIFAPFTQLEAAHTRRFQGAGLGLQIVKRIADLMNGKICVTSELGKGTSFFVLIPTAIADTDEFQPNYPSVQRVTPNPSITGRILVVEDEYVNRLTICSYLQKSGFQVDTADNGLEALKQLRSNEYDCVLMDIQMPEMDGIEATRIIRASDEFAAVNDIPIIALTAHALKGDEITFLNAGMNGYLSKPIIMQDLLEIIEKCRSAE